MKRKISIYNDIYHVVNIGVGDLSIFRTAKSKDYFCSLIERNVKKYNITIYAYAIMDNHLHLAVRITDFSVFSNFMRDVCAPYARYFNRTEYLEKNGKKIKRHGAVFAESYKSAPVNSFCQYLNLVNYIHNNPEPLSSDPRAYIWSSYNDYVSLFYKKGKNIEKNYKINIDMSYFENISYDAFKELMKSKKIEFCEGELQNNNYMTDSVLYSDIINVFKLSTAEIRSMQKDKRCKCLFMLSQIPGTYIKQIARVTGLTYSSIKKDIKNYIKSTKDPSVLEEIQKKVFDTLKGFDKSVLITDI